LTPRCAARIVRRPDQEGKAVTTDVTAGASAPAEPTARTQARTGVAARAFAWAVVPVYLLAIVAYQVLDRRLGSPGLDPVEGVMLWVGFGMFAAMGALLVGRRPGNPVGWVMAAAALLLGLAPTGDTYAAWVMTTTGTPDALAVVGAWVQAWYWMLLLWLVFAVLPLVFPDGRLPSRRWRLPAGVGAAGTAGLVLSGMLAGTLTGQDVDYRIDNPIGIEGLPGLEQQALFPLFSGLFIVGVVTGVAAVVVRVRRSRGAERQQMKWFLFAIAPLLQLPAAGLLPEWVGSIVFFWVLTALPVSIAVAVLRYRLDGIDVVINRTLVYLALTAVVAGVYVLVVGYLGAALRREDDLLISLVATGVVAVLFAPLRDRLQRGVSRLLYGQRAEPYAALSRLGQRLEGTLAPDAVLPTIVSTVREALRLPYAAISMDDDGLDRVVATAGEPVPATERVALLYQNVQVGTLVLGRRPGEETFAAADRRLLSDLARQAGVAVSAVRLTADLQRSRERLVATREEERRRLRRDLHDGLGAQLAGLTVQAGLLRRLIPTDPAAADTLAGELREELRGAIADIRRLVHGLRPPALDELGLAGALQRLAERSTDDGGGLRVHVEVDAGLPALPAAVEVAAYRIVQEALTNTVRHAAAHRCRVRLGADGNDLLVEVADDGVGLPSDAVHGVGLSSMRERAEEMGGECRVAPGPGGGTTVLARLPRTGGG
jgi:signal transduction histidine kinase